MSLHVATETDKNDQKQKSISKINFMSKRKSIQFAICTVIAYRRTSGSAFSLIVRLAEVCWINKLHMPILSWERSFEMAFCTSLVTKWQPREGAVMVISCWNQRGILGGMLADSVAVVEEEEEELLLLVLLPRDVVVGHDESEGDLWDVNDSVGLTVKATVTFKTKKRRVTKRLDFVTIIFMVSPSLWSNIVVTVLFLLSFLVEASKDLLPASADVVAVFRRRSKFKMIYH